MPTLTSEDSIDETEIVFTTTLPSVEGLDSSDSSILWGATSARQATREDATSSELPQHVEYLKNKLKRQQQRKKLLAEQESRSQELKGLIQRSVALNGESEKFNTQSAVLLAALGKLQSDLEQAQQDRQILVNEFSEIKSKSEVHTEKLSQAQAMNESLNEEARANNQLASALISQLHSLLEEGRSSQTETQDSIRHLRQSIQYNEHQHQELSEATESFKTLQQEAVSFIERAELSKSETEQRSRELTKLVTENQEKSVQFDSMLESMKELKQELLSERDEQQRLNSASRQQLKETEEINEQRSTVLITSQARIDELEQELQKSLHLNKKYFQRLQQTEEKLKETSKRQAEEGKQFEKARSLLKENEQLLADARDSLKESESQNSRFNDSLSKFQHTNEQSQNLVLRTQSSMDKLLSRNELLERENKLLAERIQSLTITGNSSKNRDFNAIGDLKFEESLTSYTDPGFKEESHNGHRDQDKTSFFRMMMVLAVMLPLGYMAASIFSTVSQLQNSAGEVQQWENISEIPASYPTRVGYLNPGESRTEDQAESSIFEEPTINITPSPTVTTPTTADSEKQSTLESAQLTAAT